MNVLKYCFRCGGHKSKDEFYNTEELASWCKKCRDTPIGQIPKL